MVKIFDGKYAQCSGQPIAEKVDDILQKIEEDWHISSYDIAAKLNIDQKTRFDSFA